MQEKSHLQCKADFPYVKDHDQDRRIKMTIRKLFHLPGFNNVKAEGIFSDCNNDYVEFYSGKRTKKVSSKKKVDAVKRNGQ